MGIIPLHVTAPLNVQTTINVWLKQALEEYVLPPQLPSWKYVEMMPESGIEPPAISIFHIPIEDTPNNIDSDSRALADISVWVTRKDHAWSYQRLYMHSMIAQTMAGFTEIQIHDYVFDPANSTPEPYRIVFGTLDAVPNVPDVNPDIERTRLLLAYEWKTRSN